MSEVVRTRRLLGWRAGTLGGLVALLIAGILAAAPLARGRKTDPPVVIPEIVATYPHDPQAFTQGLVWDEGKLLEGTGRLGFSTLREVDLATGEIHRWLDLDPRLFGEGIAVAGDKIYQLTWQNRIGYVYDRKRFALVGEFRYSGEGWGLTFDGNHLIVSDGTSILRFLDPRTFEMVRRVQVRAPKGPVDRLNELEFVDGQVWANVWYTDRIARISPETGDVLGWVDLTKLALNPKRHREDVLNGIAYDAETGRLWVTGKNWPNLYEIRLPQ